MEVRQEQALDQLLRGGWNGAAALQHYSNTEERVVHRAVVVQEALQSQQGCQEGAHANDQSEIRSIPLFPSKLP